MHFARSPLCAVVVDLPANFAAHIGRGMHVGIRQAITHRSNRLVEFTGADSLTGRSNNIGGIHRTGDEALSVRTGRLAVSATQEEHHSAGRSLLADVDVCKQGVAAFET